jgi:hypothetical protein
MPGSGLSVARLAAAIESALTRTVDGTLQRSTIAYDLAAAIVAEIEEAKVVAATTSPPILPVEGVLQ